MAKQEKETKLVMYRGKYIEVDVDATSIPENAEGMSPADFANKDNEGAETGENATESNRTQAGDPLESYVAGTENMSSPNTKPWYKHELMRLGVDFEQNAGVAELKKTFEEAVRSGKTATTDE